MSEAYILDAFPAFEQWWGKAHREPLPVQIATWPVAYGEQWPDLVRIQIDSYREDGVDWRTVAGQRVFPALSQRVPVMLSARDHLRTMIEGVYRLAQERVGLDFDVIFLIHVGIGLGAGWATRFRGMPACLLGLENIAELGWTDDVALAALAAHEIGHLAHENWRQEALSCASGPLWTLYLEGLAMRVEHRIMGRETWHEQTGQAGWLEWCQANQGNLARQFLTRMESSADTKDFFGSWYEIDGYAQSGYYLGHEVVRRLEEQHTLREIALFTPDQVTANAKHVLDRMAQS